MEMNYNLLISIATSNYINYLSRVQMKLFVPISV